MFVSLDTLRKWILEQRDKRIIKIKIWNNSFEWREKWIDRNILISLRIDRAQQRNNYLCATSFASNIILRWRMWSGYQLCVHESKRSNIHQKVMKQKRFSIVAISFQYLFSSCVSVYFSLVKLFGLSHQKWIEKYPVFFLSFLFVFFVHYLSDAKCNNDLTWPMKVMSSLLFVESLLMGQQTSFFFRFVLQSIEAAPWVCCSASLRFIDLNKKPNFFSPINWNSFQKCHVSMSSIGRWFTVHY